jgi:hypothetical protein
MEEAWPLEDISLNLFGVLASFKKCIKKSFDFLFSFLTPSTSDISTTYFWGVEITQSSERPKGEMDSTTMQVVENRTCAFKI